MVDILVDSEGKALTTSGKAIKASEGSGGEFQLTRVKDDNNVEIGTHFMDFTDGDGQKYKVVLLDAQYRLQYGVLCSSSNQLVTNLPFYMDLLTFSIPVWKAKETATFNTQKILDYCTANNYTSSICSHCRSKSFVINGTTYYGQLPNFVEVSYITEIYEDLNSMDTSASSYSNLTFTNTRGFWSSTQNSNNTFWGLFTVSYYATRTYTQQGGACPVLEIPY